MATKKDGGQQQTGERSPTDNTPSSSLNPDTPGRPLSPFLDDDIPDLEGPPWAPEGNPLHGVGPPPPLPSRPPWAPPPQCPTPPEPIPPLTPDHILPPDPAGPPYPDTQPFSPFTPPGPPQPLIPPFPPTRGGNPPCPPGGADPDADIQPGGPRAPLNPRFPPPGRGPTYLSYSPQNAPENGQGNMDNDKN